MNDVHSRLMFFDNRTACEWLTTKEAAAYLGISPNALRIMVHRGMIPVYKLGSRLRFRFQDLRSTLKRKGDDLCQ
jgi:excisionase family DNA binding protein